MKSPAAKAGCISGKAASNKGRRGAAGGTGLVKPSEGRGLHSAGWSEATQFSVHALRQSEATVLAERVLRSGPAGRSPTERLEVRSNVMGKIFSINFSSCKGVPKEQVPRAVLVKNRGIKDDAHAGMELRQVSLLDMESIRLQIADAKTKKATVEIRPGIYAENITTEGIDLSVLKRGDELRIGATAVLRISKIGKECHSHCAIYHQVGDCIMPRKGIFGEVMEGGEIAVGDAIEKLGGRAAGR